MKKSLTLISTLGRLSLLCLLMLTVFSCKSKKIATQNADEHLGIRRILAEHAKAEPDFKTLVTRVQLTYDDGKSKQRINANIRMKKNEVIWMKASILGITVAKALLTPDSVSVYESLSKTYFEGDYRWISNWLGIDLSFDQVQALLLGQSTLELKANALHQSISDNKYILEPKQPHALYRQSLAIYPNNFKIANQTMEEIQEKRIFTLDYSDYQKVGKDFYPSNINLQSIGSDKTMRLHFQVRKVDVNPNIGFPYEIPNTYKPMSLD